MPAFTTSRQHFTGSSRQNSWAIKRNTRHQDQKGRSKTISFHRWMILHKRNSKKITKELLELINKLCKVARLQDQHTKITL